MNMATAASLGNAIQCQYCGFCHGATCPRVKAFEYYPDGTLKRVEFHETKPIDMSQFAATSIR